MVNGRAADTKHARPEALEEADQVGVGPVKERREQRLLLVGQAEEAGIEGACGRCEATVNEAAVIAPTGRGC